MTKATYAWIGDDGGWKIGDVVGSIADMLLMQRYHEPLVIEIVRPERVRLYPETPIKEPTS